MGIMDTLKRLAGKKTSTSNYTPQRYGQTPGREGATSQVIGNKVVPKSSYQKFKEFTSRMDRSMSRKQGTTKMQQQAQYQFQRTRGFTKGIHKTITKYAGPQSPILTRRRTQQSIRYLVGPSSQGAGGAVTYRVAGTSGQTGGKHAGRPRLSYKWKDPQGRPIPATVYYTIRRRIASRNKVMLEQSKLKMMQRGIPPQIAEQSLQIAQLQATQQQIQPQVRQNIQPQMRAYPQPQYPQIQQNQPNYPNYPPNYPQQQQFTQETDFFRGGKILKPVNNYKEAWLR